uniref:PA domain-containing protein n=1 Tax=Biomphalaria glabrata TaxID=6526 RepID=A0A2C9KJK2_BIOGL
MYTACFVPVQGFWKRRLKPLQLSLICSLMMMVIIKIPHKLFLSAEEIATAPNYYVVFEESVYFEITWPESLMYTFKLKQAKDFGTVFDKLHEDVELILADPEDACQDLLNEIHGAVVLIRRGECSFLAKSKTAEKAGALAAIIFDNDENNDNSMIEMIDDETHRIVHIPAYFLLGKDGAMIRRQLYMLQTDRALINIPINLTGKPHTAARRPPWTIW